MKLKAKITLVIGFLVIIIVSSGIYLDNKLDHLLQQSGSLLLSGDTNSSADQESDIIGENEKADDQSEANSNNSRLNSSGADREDVVNHIQKKVDQPIEKVDLLKVSIIAVRKLSAEDIKYLSKVAMQNSYSQEDYRHSREILEKKLSADDINALKEIGKKYGKEIKL